MEELPAVFGLPDSGRGGMIRWKGPSSAGGKRQRLSGCTLLGRSKTRCQGR